MQKLSKTEGELVGPEGRVDGSVVPGGEEGRSHVVDQVNHFYLQQDQIFGNGRQSKSR